MRVLCPWARSEGMKRRWLVESGELGERIRIGLRCPREPRCPSFPRCPSYPRFPRGPSYPRNFRG